ncbi:MAG TPA: hypothetical protein EYN06_05385, partial [Myxococcales bacterium]|nr:hypothetical protein [Myxococcales bacterium]
MKQPLITLSALLLCVAGAGADEADWWDTGAFQCALSHYAEHGSQTFHGKDAERHRPPDRVVDFTHMQADLSIDPIQGSVAGTVKHTFKAIGRPCSELVLHAGGDIKIESLKDDQGNDLAFTHRDESITISLNKDLPVDQSSQIQIRYHSHPKDGLNFVHATVGGKRIREAWTQGETTFTRYWIPIWDYPNDRFTSEVTTRVPADYRVIGNGELVSESVEGKIRVRQFKMAQSHVAYLLSLCIGRFEEIKDLTGPVPLWFVIYPEDKANLPNSLRRTGEVIRVLSELSGHAYPYAKYSQTVASEYPIGGMENVSATTLRRNRVNYDSSAALVYDVTGLVAHEAAHQWFGNIVTCRDWAHIWLNEGFATYLTSLFFERADGKAAGMNALRGMNGWYFGETQRYTRPLVTYVMDKPGSMFDAHSYVKGAWVLHMLRHKMGDKLFFKGMAAYLQRYWEKVADTADFRRVMEDISGLNLEAFFAQWVYRAGHPKLTAKVKVQTRQDRIVIELSQQTAKPFDMGLVIRVTGRSGYRDWPVRFRQAHRTVEIPLKEAPRTIEFDPDGVLLKELELEIRPLWLFAQVQHGSTAWARADAARELGKLTGRERVVSALMAAAANPKEPLMVSKAAVKSLGKLATPEACAALMTQIKVDNAKLRYAVFKALKKCKQGPVASVLIQTIDSDASVHVRSAA